MAVTGRDITDLYQGTTRTLDVSILDASGTAVDLSSVTGVEWVMAPNAYGTAVISKSLGDGIAITDEAGGLVTIALLPADTEDLPCGRYYHECRVSEGENVTKVFTGHVTLLRDLI